jgi:hypothetical protein
VCGAIPTIPLARPAPGPAKMECTSTGIILGKDGVACCPMPHCLAAGAAAKGYRIAARWRSKRMAGAAGVLRRFPCPQSPVPQCTQPRHGGGCGGVRGAGRRAGGVGWGWNAQPQAPKRIALVSQSHPERITHHASPFSVGASSQFQEPGARSRAGRRSKNAPRARRPQRLVACRISNSRIQLAIRS